MSSSTTLSLEEVRRYLRRDMPALERRSAELAREFPNEEWVYGAEEIHGAMEAYSVRHPHYREALIRLEESLYDSDPTIKMIHSVKWRTKDQYHLIDKLRRKFLEDPPKRITLENIFTPGGVTDLGGIRILHLYRQQWKAIHNFIVETRWGGRCEIIEKKAYIRRADKREYARYFDEIIYEKPQMGSWQNRRSRRRSSDYTSLHYVMRVLDYAPKRGTNLRDVYVECQVRTVFEDGWGEVDHDVRYPFDTTEMVKDQLHILSQSAHIANDIATALESLNSLPVFIPWQKELELERRAERVFCLTPDLRWAAERIRTLVDLLNNSSVMYYFLLLPMTQRKRLDRRTLKKIEARVAKIKTALDGTPLSTRVEFLRMREIDIPLALPSDLLLLQGVHEARKDPYHVAIMAAPLTNLSKSEQLDIVIQDEDTVEGICRFFDSLTEDATISLKYT
jgi:ppGpp synthetase/RelA/SpoT-type nucleotidyltranferase